MLMEGRGLFVKGLKWTLRKTSVLYQRPKVTKSSNVGLCRGSDDKVKDSNPSWKFWKRISLMIALPAVALLTAGVMFTHKKAERQPFVPYEHLRIRTKRFPWGDGKRTLFHNPHLNPLPEGYEDEIQSSVELDEEPGDANGGEEGKDIETDKGKDQNENMDTGPGAD